MTRIHVTQMPFPPLGAPGRQGDPRAPLPAELDDVPVAPLPVDPREVIPGAAEPVSQFFFVLSAATVRRA